MSNLKGTAALGFDEVRAELRQIIGDVIGADISHIEDEAPLLEYIPSSLTLVEGLGRVHERFGVLVSIQRILAAEATIGSLAIAVHEALGRDEDEPDEDDGTGAGVAATRLPLAESQRHVGFLMRYSPGASGAYNEAVAVRLTGPLELRRLEAAIGAVAQQRQALHAALDQESDALELRPDQPLRLTIKKTTAAEAPSFVNEIVERAFEPGERLFRAELLQVSADERLLVLVGHALTIEREALWAVLDEIAVEYSGGHAATKATELGEYLGRAAAFGERGAEAALGFWRETFADGVPNLELPRDRPRPAVKTYAGGRVSATLNSDLERRITEWVGSEKVTKPALLFSAFATLLHRISGQKTVVVGVAGGPLYVNSEDERVIGPTRNLVPVLSDYEPEQSFGESTRERTALLAKSFYHGRLSLSELIQQLDLPRDRSRSPLFSAAFRAETAGEPSRFGDLTAQPMSGLGAGARYDIELRVEFGAQASRLTLEYSSDLFDEASARLWLTGLMELLRAATSDEAACGDLPVMAPEELELLIEGWNDTAADYPRDRTTLDLILNRASASAQQPAVRFAEGEWTYGDLAKRVDEIAGGLAARGVGRGDRVAVLVERSPDLVAALLAVWRTGAAYVPLDPKFPRQRIAYVVEDSEAAAVLVTAQTAGLLNDSFPDRQLQLDTLTTGAFEPPAPPHPDDVAYLIYTSGSTGRPKGVEIRHFSLVNFLLGSGERIGFREGDELLALTTVSFDISALELWLPLVSGGVIRLAEDGLVGDGIALAERLDAVRPKFVQATPSTWKMVLAAGWIGDRDLHILSAGEAIHRDLAEQLLVRCRSLWNMYGPTETTVFSTLDKIASAPGEPIKIGRPYPNTQIYVLDTRLRPVPIGVVGDLYIGGDGVAKGYWRRPELTAQRFLPSPFRPNERIYATGDLARYLPSGELLWLGRRDDQVKIHGVRVELGEVESALREIDSVSEAVVVAWRDSHGDDQLVAHITPVAEPPAGSEIRARLRERLPEAMIPPHIRFLSELPKTANGKVQRSALPAPGDDPVAAQPAASKPVTETERELAAIWAELLEIDAATIGRDDGFLELGGHSLLVTRLMFESSKRFNARFSMREFFEASTLQALGALIDQRRRARPGAGRGPQRPTARGPEWARERMAYLRREGDLPAAITPMRGQFYRPPSEINDVLLTGATGFLGTYLVYTILRKTSARLYCLVRAKAGVDGKERIREQMQRYDVWAHDEAFRDAWEHRLEVVEGDVTLPRLGLRDNVHETLARELDAILHSAAHVNFIYPYEALRTTNVLGLHEVLRFALHGRIKPVHHLSTAAIWPMGADHVFYEDDPLDHGELLNLGYDESKWVAEQCLVNAADRGLPIARYRPGEVGGDSKTGRCVLDHFIFACVKGFLQAGAFPDIKCNLDIAPVDYVSQAVVHLALEKNAVGQAYHLTNPNCLTTSEALDLFEGLGYRFDVLPFEEVRARLVADPDLTNNPLFIYQAALAEMDARSLEIPKYDTTIAERALEGSGIRCPPVDFRLLGTYLHYLRSVGFMPEPLEAPVA